MQSCPVSVDRCSHYQPARRGSSCRSITLIIRSDYARLHPSTHIPSSDRPTVKLFCALGPLTSPQAPELLTPVMVSKNRQSLRPTLRPLSVRFNFRKPVQFHAPCVTMYKQLRVSRCRLRQVPFPYISPSPRTALRQNTSLPNTASPIHR